MDFLICSLKQTASISFKICGKDSAKNGKTDVRYLKYAHLLIYKMHNLQSIASMVHIY